MGTSVVTGPDSEPVTLTEAKDHLRVGISEDDGLIAGYIFAARSWIEGQIQRPIVSRLYDHTIDYGWSSSGCRQLIDLPYPPLLSVRSVSYVDEGGTTQVLASSQYTVVTNGARGRIFPAYNVQWPSVRRTEQAITVRFIAGYSDFDDGVGTATGPGIPDELRQAVMTQVEIFLDRDPSMHESLTKVVEALISPFRVSTF